MTGIWAWFLSTRVGRWTIGIGAVLAAFGVACLYWFERGKHDGKQEGLADAAEQAAKDAQAAATTYADASQAALQVAQQAAKQPPPDPVKRDDLDNTF